MKTPRQLERYFKGAANHWRIAIMLELDEQDLSLDGIARNLSGNFKNISQHTRYLVQAGLLNKKHQGTKVIHSLSPYGRAFLKFMHSIK